MQYLVTRLNRVIAGGRFGNVLDAARGGGNQLVTRAKGAACDGHGGALVAVAVIGPAVAGRRDGNGPGFD